MAGGIIKSTCQFDNYGMRIKGTVTNAETDEVSTFYQNYRRVVPQIKGLYVMDKHVRFL